MVYQLEAYVNRDIPRTSVFGLKEHCTNYVRSRRGFQPEINEQLQKEVSIEFLPPSKRYVALLIDEMKVKEDLVYDKHTGQVVGFVSVSDVHGDLSNIL